MKLKKRVDSDARIFGLPTPIIFAIAAIFFYLLVFWFVPPSTTIPGVRDYPETYPDGGVRLPSLSTSVKNFLWLFFSSLSTLWAVVVLYRGAQSAKERPFFAVSLYVASAILCIEVLIAFISPS